MSTSEAFEYATNGYYEVRDNDSKIRYQSLRKIDAEEFARKLIATGERAPDIFFIENTDL